MDTITTIAMLSLLGLTLTVNMVNLGMSMTNSGLLVSRYLKDSAVAKVNDLMTKKEEDVSHDCVDVLANLLVNRWTKNEDEIAKTELRLYTMLNDAERTKEYLEWLKYYYET